MVQEFKNFLVSADSKNFELDYNVSTGNDNNHEAVLLLEH